MLQVEENTKTVNDDVMAAEGMCRVSGKVAYFVTMHSKLFTPPHTHHEM
jgi:hypothetical protein